MQQSVTEVRALLRALLREGRKFPNYNVRKYVQRRALDAFRDGQNAASEAWPALINQARADLALVKRQSVVYGLFGHKVKSVLELDEAQEKALRRGAEMTGRTV